MNSNVMLQKRARHKRNFQSLLNKKKESDEVQMGRCIVFNQRYGDFDVSIFVFGLK